MPNKFGIKVGGAKKLVPNLRDKIKYVVHYKNLQLYLKLEMKLSRIHRILKFKQSNWLKEYIEFTTEKRKCATNSFEKQFFKVLNNSIYGKCMENLRKRINVKLIKSVGDYLKIVSKPNFISQKIFSKNIIAVHQIKSALNLNKPIYVGFGILELSRLLMYKFHYEYVSNTRNSAKLLFTDTDSLVYEIKDQDIYEQCFKDRDVFDFSECPVSSEYYDSSNKKALRKMKDELNGIKILEVVGLKSKMYSLISVDYKKVSKAKAVNKKVRHKEFVDALFKKNVVRHNMNRIQSKSHMIGNYNVFKISLSYFDDKRYVLEV